MAASMGDALPQPREVLEDFFGAVGATPIGREPAEPEIVEHGQVRQDPSLLGNPGDPLTGDLVRRHSRQVLAAQQDPAAARLGDAHDRAERRRLAGAVRPMIVTTSPWRTVSEMPCRMWASP